MNKYKKLPEKEKKREIFDRPFSGHKNDQTSCLGEKIPTPKTKILTIM